MEVIIAGAGIVGYRLAQTLSEKHNVYVIDKNAEAISRLSEKLDVMPIHGDVEDPDTYSAFLNRNFDIFIAVTNSDEANILSTLIADDIINVDTKIIRLKNKYFAKSSIAEKLGITEAVFPYIETAKSISELVDFPKANNVKSLPFTNYLLVSVKAKSSKLRFYDELCFEKVCVVAFERSKQLYIPENQLIEEGDLIYLFGSAEHIKDVCEKIDSVSPTSIKNVAVFGADLLGIEIVRELGKKDVNIKLVEEDPELCEKAVELLHDKITVINSKYSEHSLFEEENISSADMVVACSEDDEDNIIKSLEAKEFGVKKCVAINNNIHYYDLMHNLSLTAVRGPKSNAYYAILEKMGSSNVVGEKHFCGGRGVVFVRKVFRGSSLTKKEIYLDSNSNTIAFLIRGDKITKISGKVILQEDDVIALFSHSKFEEKVRRWIYNL
ncbi:NAD-binding protein [Persephonella sp.]